MIPLSFHSASVLENLSLCEEKSCRRSSSEDDDDDNLFHIYSINLQI